MSVAFRCEKTKVSPCGEAFLGELDARSEVGRGVIRLRHVSGLETDRACQPEQEGRVARKLPWSPWRSGRWVPGAGGPTTSA